LNIIIENIRCFYGENIVPVTPITLLVGENSAGKSTFLAVLAAMTNSGRFPLSPGFNTPPYDLGNYENIATQKSMNAKPAASFKIGFVAEKTDNGGERTAIATYRGHLGQVVLSEFTVTAPNGKIRVETQKKDVRVHAEYLNDATNETVQFEFATKLPDRESMVGAEFMSLLIVEMLTSAADKPRAVGKVMAMKLISLVQGGTFPFRNVLSIAPIRTKPRRTYDQFNEEFKPEGDHVPQALARLLEAVEADEQAYRENVKNALERFGQESGLFERVEIERLGKEPSSPFRVAVYLRVCSKRGNLRDFSKVSAVANGADFSHNVPTGTGLGLRPAAR
jgi:AAA domain